MVNLSIIIVNFNTRELLEQCLTSLESQEGSVGFETIVVDNASRDSSVDLVRDKFPYVQLIANDENEGFARANNQGMKNAKGKYILLLNSDTRILGNALETMVRFLDNSPEVAVVTGRLVYPDFTDQGVARNFPTPMNALFGRRSILTKIFPKNKYARNYLVSRFCSSTEPFEVDWVSGACLMVRKAVLEAVGLLDEGFWMYWEDADLCYRIKKQGWKVYCTPKALVIHYEGQSVCRKTSNRCIIEFNKSVYRYYRKHYIKSAFSLLNLLASGGLVVRTLVLLGLNIMKVNRPLIKRSS